MLNKIKSYLLFGNRFCGIEHTIKNGKGVIITSLLKKAKNQVDIEHTSEVSSIDDAFNSLPKKQHITLVINNDNVITKRVIGNINNDLKVVYQAFPNINLDDFYYELVKQKSNRFISICRKEYVDNLIEQYSQLGVSVINFSLGNSLISSVTRFINSEEKIATSNAYVSIEKEELVDIKKINDLENRTYDINGLSISNHTILSFSGALQSVLKSNNSNTNFETQKKNLLREYNNKRFFNQFLKYAGLLILGLLFINFLFFNHYYNKVNELQQTSQINLTTKKKILDLSKSVNKTQEMVDNMLKSSSSKSSFYANAIVQSLPNSILLSQLNYQPLLKRIKAEKDIELNSNVILVSGDSNSSEVFSKWINDIETNDWVKNVEIIDYSDLTRSKSTFSLKININND
ncbi:hypothetical protein [uncultured Lacinutrix sp.]|uniref:hypothetical protein n=1 Tax=uncultured Lacinutrix sp. TaxID=574032 RepID=UPI0026094AED|nr:hypothetical protein [uncultured Lacinutrix sp.]